MTDTPVSQDDRRQAEVVAEHLPEGYSHDFDGAGDTTAAAYSSTPDLTNPQEQSSLKLQGGDIHRDLYKVEARSRLHQRSYTFSGPPVERPSPDMPAAEQRLPGGFRREYVQRKQGFSARNVPIARNFIEFLDLYGNFAGEDLAETDSDDELSVDDAEQGDRRPLLGRRKSTRVTKPGDASTSKTFFTLLKAFIGTGIMFLPRAFQNGGIIFATVTLISVSLISTLAFHLLLKCRERYKGGYGELGEAIGGPKMRALILGSITISQLGFVCAGTVFVAENLKSFVDAVSKGPDGALSTKTLIALQLIVLIPLALIRNISKLGPAAMLADVFIFLGLFYIWYYDIAFLAQHGLNSTVITFNPAHYTLTIGASIFTFEGIGLLLPIQSSMKNPQKFEWLLYLVMGIITVIFTSVGLLCYATFGSDTQIEVINNFPQTSKLVNAVQFTYSLAVLVGTPVQLFPAVRILEGKLFGRASGKNNPMIQWKKNGFRTLITVLCILVSILGSANLDQFVALIGSFACVPLVYIYPPLLHYKGIAESRWVKAGDIILMVGGIFAMVFTTSITVVNNFLR